MNLIDHSFYSQKVLERYDRLAGVGRLIKQGELLIMDDVLQRRRLLEQRCDSIVDVGTCTGRYLRWGNENGFTRLYGIDHSADAINFCQSTLNFSCELRHGDCTQASTFHAMTNIDVICMMMGTFNHLSVETASEFLCHASTVSGLRSNLVISTWNVPPVDLNIYSSRQAFRLQSNRCVEILKQEIVGSWKFSRKYSAEALDVWVYTASNPGCGANG